MTPAVLAAGVALVVLMVLVAIRINRFRPGPGSNDPPQAPIPADYRGSMRPIESARTHLERTERDQLRLTIEHELLRDVTPEMLVWWFRTFPARTLEVRGKSIPWYQLWHPVDHVEVRVRREGEPGIPGFSEGARIEIHEQLSPDHSLPEGGIATVHKLDRTGIVLSLDVGPIRVARLEHRFRPVDEGTRYESELIVGTDWPLLGGPVNTLLTTCVFTEEVGRAWFKHNVEEVGNFEFFLPELYRRHGPGSRRDAGD